MESKFKKEQVGTRITAELKQQIMQVAANEGKTISEVLENALNQHFAGGGEKTETLLNEIETLQERVEAAELKAEQYIKLVENEREYYEKKCIVLQINSLHEQILGMWLEIKEKTSKLKRNEDVMYRIYSLFIKAYGEVDSEYVEQARKFKEELVNN